MREEVEGLEDDADPSPYQVHVHTRGRHVLAVNDDAPRVDRLEQVDAAKQCRLAGAGRADQADDLVLGHREIDAAQHLELAEALPDPFEEHRRAGAHDSTPA